MNNVQPHQQNSLFTGVPLITQIALPGSIKIYMLLHIPHGYELVPGSPFQSTDIDHYVSEVKLQACSASCNGSVQIIEVREVTANAHKNETKVLVTGHGQNHEVIVAHIGTESTGQDGVLNAPLTFVQTGVNHRAVHYSAWLPSSCSLNITNSKQGSQWTHTIDVTEDDPTLTEMTFFRNCIWIEKATPPDWPEVTIEVKRGGKTRKVMVSTSDGSVGTGDGQNVPKT